MTVADDLPGHGDTPCGPGDWTFDQAAVTLRRVVDTVGGGPAHIVGISVGGMIAQTFALAFPERVSSLSLVGTAASFSEDAR